MSHLKQVKKRGVF